MAIGEGFVAHNRLTLEVENVEGFCAGIPEDSAEDGQAPARGYSLAFESDGESFLQVRDDVFNSSHARASISGFLSHVSGML